MRLSQRGQQLTHQRQRPDQVHLELLAQFLRRDLLQRPGLEVAGVAHKRVQPPVLKVDRTTERGNLVLRTVPITVQPISTRRIAASRPKPDEVPVTTATRCLGGVNAAWLRVHRGGRRGRAERRQHRPDVAG